MEIISLTAFFIAMLLGIKLLDYVIQLLDKYIDGYEHALPVISFAIIFIGVVLSLNLIGKGLKTILDMTLLGSLDDIAGSILGILKWALFISIFFWVFNNFGGSLKEETTETSILYQPIKAFAPGLFGFFSNMFPHFMEYFEQTQESINQIPIGV